MKRNQLLKHLRKHGASFLREGSKHSIMKYRAVIKKVDDWWIGWLVDLSGVNAQERTKAELIESLRIGAKEMLATEISFEPDSFMTTINIPDPDWAISS